MKRLIPFLLFAAFSFPMMAQHSHDNQHDPVQLNDGKRWIANAETTQGIASMMERVKVFQSEKEASIADLHKNLQSDFSEIFAKCTMEGAAHDQLHNYLLPLRDLLNELTDCDDCAHITQHIKKHLEDYSKYFE